jgi:hypothetical protein
MLSTLPSDFSLLFGHQHVENVWLAHLLGTFRPVVPVLTLKNARGLVLAMQAVLAPLRNKRGYRIERGGIARTGSGPSVARMH